MTACPKNSNNIMKYVHQLRTTKSVIPVEMSWWQRSERAPMSCSTYMPYFVFTYHKTERRKSR